MSEAGLGVVVNLLHGPEGFGNEMQRQEGISAERDGSLIQELEREELDAEARACRLPTRGNVSEEVFKQEITWVSVIPGGFMQRSISGQLVGHSAGHTFIISVNGTGSILEQMELSAR